MNESWSRLQRATILVAAVVAALGLWYTSDRNLGNVTFILVSIGAAAAVAWFLPTRPAVSFGILFLVASLSRGTIATPLGNMRFEQPAIVAGFAALVMARSRLDIARLRSLWPIGAAFAMYLFCLALSSALFAPDKADSFRMTFWTGLSMAGGVLAFLLLSRDGGRATAWIMASGYLQAIAGFVFAILFFALGPVLIAGPTPAPGVQDPLGVLPKVFSLSWEANIYASFLAALTPLGINRLLSGGGKLNKLLLPVMVAAIGLGVTRGAYIGLATGIATYAVLAFAPWRFWTRPYIQKVSIRVAGVAASFGIGLLLAGVLMAGGRPTTQPLDVAKPDFGRAPAASSQQAAASFKVGPPPDTLVFRLDRVPEALADVPHSLVVGLGADSFGQRHGDPSSNGAPDHIAILALAALYESGILGSAGLGMGFALVLLVMLKATRRRVDRGRIAAYGGSVVCLLAAYEATNALNFVLIWLLVGAGLAAALEPIEPPPADRPAVAS